ncbi:MAG TPA: Hpt domain-containing protein [Phycisphaerae bacterium]|nr:Hpt domain-containing protein [Phycisphaerae bacterium]
MPANVDPALLDLFRAEMDTHIPVLSQGLLELEKGRAGGQEIAAMMRAAHSIKGAARIVGIEAAVRLAHVMEDCFTAAKETRIRLTSEAVDVLLQGVDALQRICSPEPDPDLSETQLESLHERLTATKEGRLPPPAAASPPPRADAVGAMPLASSAPAEEEMRLTLPADLDDAAAEALRGQLCGAFGQGVPRIHLDFSQVRRLTAGAMSVLLSCAREAARTQPALLISVSGVAGPVAALMRVSGLDRACGSPG